MKFDSLEDEFSRSYVFPNKEIVTIYAPVMLNVSESGGHRVLDNDGVSHYIPSGWIHLYWKVKKGTDPFAF
jgi:hypothetical protein